MTGEVPLGTPHDGPESHTEDAGGEEQHALADEQWPEVLRMARPPGLTNPAIGEPRADYRDASVRSFTHRAYERLAGYCSRERSPEPQPGAPASGPPTQGPAGGWHPSQGRLDVCRYCNARRTCCHCWSDVDDLRRFARRMAELHERTGTPVCGCGAHNCYVRTRLDDIGAQGRS